MSPICPGCQHEEIEGTIYCTQCGTKIITEGDSSTLVVNPKDETRTTEGEAVKELPYELPPTPRAEAPVTLYLVRTGELFPLTGRTEFSIGRRSERQSIVPDIDLSAHGAYIYGVSRMHAIIKIHDGKVFISDLGSTNGTRINNKKTTAHKEYQLHNGDHVFIGRLKFMVLIEENNHTPGLN